MNIVHRIVSPQQQRYPTAGDWQFLRRALINEAGSWTFIPELGGDYVSDEVNPEVLLITVSDTSDWRMNALIGMHEEAEALLCRNEKIRGTDVDAFDKEFERKRATDDDSEPGDDPRAPYQNQHNFATAIERMMCAAFGIPWAYYEEQIP